MAHHGDVGFILQAVYDLNKCVGAIGAKLDGISSDLRDLRTRIDAVSDKVDGAEKKVAFLKGIGVTITVLLPLLTGGLWWLIGDKISDLKEQLLAPAQEQPRDAVPPVKPGKKANGA